MLLFFFPFKVILLAFKMFLNLTLLDFKGFLKEGRTKESFKRKCFGLHMLFVIVKLISKVIQLIFFVSFRCILYIIVYSDIRLSTDF